MIRMQPVHSLAALRERGISLIESLVALLVLALGILGLAGLQTRTLVESRTTNARAVAISMVEDLSERMQFNVDARLINPNPYLVAWNVQPAAPDDPDCFDDEPCTAAQLAQLDVAQWKANLAALLPGGDATVFALPADNTQLGVLIGWRENESDKADDLADGANYRAPLNINTGVAGQACPQGLICHLVYIRP